MYVYKGDPFQPGPLEVDTATFNTVDGIPKRTEGRTVLALQRQCTRVRERLCSSAYMHVHYSCHLHAVFFPTTAGSYIPILFIPGVFGAIYTEWYSTVLSNLASYGVIVAGVDVQWPLLDGVLDSRQWREKFLHMTYISAEPATLFEVLEWVRL